MVIALYLLLFLALHVYIGWNGILFLKALHVAYSLPAYWIVIALLASSYIIGRWRPLGAVGRFFKVIGSYYFAILEFALFLLPLADLAGWICMHFGLRSERVILWIGTIVLVILVVLLIRGSWNAWNPIVRSYDVEIQKHAGNRKELRMAVVSDIHLGNIVGNRHLHTLIKQLNNMKPDLILLPGDVLDDEIEPFVRNRMKDTMKHVRADLGVFAVLGNHEYYGGQIEEYRKEMESIGLQVLIDQSVLVDNAFYIVGRDDKTAERKHGRAEVAELVAGLDLSKPVILLDHQPYELDKARAAGIDVMLSGHTHRGQFAPNHWITRRLFELDWGYVQKESLHVIVSSGYGTWGPPIRLASRSEIVQVNIRFM